MYRHVWKWRRLAEHTSKLALRTGLKKWPAKDASRGHPPHAGNPFWACLPNEKAALPGGSKTFRIKGAE